MLINLAQARRLLTAAHLTDRRARDVLASGLAGEPRRIGSRSYVDDAAVAELTSREVLGRWQLDERFPVGWVVWRSPVAVASAPAQEQRHALSACLGDISLWSRVGLQYCLESRPFPLLATVGSFVYCGADMVAAGPDRSVTIGPPGPWYEELRRTRLWVGRGPALVLQVDLAEAVAKAEAEARVGSISPSSSRP